MTSVGHLYCSLECCFPKCMHRPCVLGGEGWREREKKKKKRLGVERDRDERGMDEVIGELKD